MKKLFLIWAVLMGSAHAAGLYAQNEGGGRIVLTDEVCRSPSGTYKALTRAYAYTSKGTTAQGCWAYAYGAIHVVWDDGERRIYNLDAFSPLPD